MAAIEQRVIRAAEAALAQRDVVTAIDVLVGLGWLTPANVEDWRYRRVPYLERVTVAGLGKISTAMKTFRAWAKRRGLQPSETAYRSRTRDKSPLRFSKSGNPNIELAYRTHWVRPGTSSHPASERVPGRVLPVVDRENGEGDAAHHHEQPRVD